MSPTYQLYDYLGRKTSRTLPLGMTEHFGYNARGLKSTHTDFNGETTYYDYDAHNRLYRVDAPDGESITYAYYPDGKRQTVSDSRGATGYTYDVRGRLDTVSNPDGSGISYTYDAVGNRTSLLTLRSLGEAGQTTSYTYDDLNRLETVTAPDLGVTSYTYTLQGKPDLVTYPNGTVADHDYDDLGRLTYLENRKADSSIISSYDYTLDAAGNRTQVTEADGRTVGYTYDNLHRLLSESITEADLSTRSHTYTYDWVGNRESKETCVEGVCELVSYEYNVNNQLVTETATAGVTSYFYDSNGNTIEKTDGVEVTTYSWDWANRMVGATTSDHVLEFGYDAEGARVSKTVDGVEVGFLVDKNRPYAQVLEERDEVGGLVGSYVYGSDLVSMDRGGVESWYHYDGLGSTRALSDASAAVSDEYSYTAYGVPLDSSGTTDNAYGFAGEQTDDETGLQYLRARYYDPWSGRFASMDPCVGCGHEYGYGGSNPVCEVDPSGKINVSLTQITVSLAIVSVLATTASLAYSTHKLKYSYDNAHYRGIVTLLGGGAIIGGAWMTGSVWTECRYGHYREGWLNAFFFGAVAGLIPAGGSVYTIKQEDWKPGRNDLKSMSGFSSIAALSGAYGPGFSAVALRLGQTMSVGDGGTDVDFGWQVGLDADAIAMNGISTITSITAPIPCTKTKEFNIEP